MKTMLSLNVLTITIALMSYSFFSIAQAVEKPNKKYRYIVMYQAKHHSQSLNIATQSIEVLHKLSGGHGLVARLTQEQAHELQENPNIQLVERDQPRFLPQQPQTINAFHIPEPYGNAMVQADQVSDTQTGNQKICLIDSGYDIEHEDLSRSAHITGEISNTLREDIDLEHWSTDSYGHGTHIAGSLVALNNAWGMTGIAPNNYLPLHHVKVIHNTNYWSIWASDVIDAVNRCQTAGATIINMSLAGASPSQAEEQAIAAAYDNGILLVGAAGHRGNNAYFYPAAYDDVIAVTAVNEEQQIWPASQQHDQIELAAPGVAVSSTLPNNRYGQWDGNGMATPFVSGVAALVWSQFPECSQQQIRTVLQQTALDKGEEGQDSAFGHGIVQAKKAVDLIDSAGCSGSLSLLGEQITVRRAYPNVDTDFSVGPQMVTVIEGEADIVRVQSHANINIDAHAIYIDFLNSSNFGFTVFNGYVFTGFTKPINNITASTSNISIQSIEFGDGFIYLNLMGRFNSTSWIELQIE